MNDQDDGTPLDAAPIIPEDQPIRERIYDVVLQLRGPTSATEVAERTDCDAGTAREYLRWFARIGLVTEHEGRPATFERNDLYFELQEIARLHRTADETLAERLEELTATVATFEDRYDADRPGEVDALAYADHDSIDRVWRELREWETTVREIERIEFARRSSSLLSASA